MTRRRLSFNTDNGAATPSGHTQTTVTLTPQNTHKQHTQAPLQNPNKAVPGKSGSQAQANHNQDFVDIPGASPGGIDSSNPESSNSDSNHPDSGSSDANNLDFNNVDIQPSSSNDDHSSKFLEFTWSANMTRIIFIATCVLEGLLVLAMVTIFVLWWKLRMLRGKNGGAYSEIEGTMEEERESFKPKQGLRQLSSVR